VAPPVVTQPSAPLIAAAPRGAGAGAPPPPPPSLIFGAGATPPQAPAPAAALAPPPPAATQPPASGITLIPPGSRPTETAAAAPTGGDARIVIRATAEVWVEVRDQASKPIFMKLMRRGDSYSVPNRSGLTLSSGRASALTMTVDGEPVDVQRRSVPLDADDLKRRGG
jgi:cytoskeleton protein RodZ